MKEKDKKSKQRRRQKRVWLIRHAESEANAGARTYDPGIINLTAKGVEQARLLAETFEKSPQLIVTSPYVRTKQTAKPLIEKHPDVPHIEWQVHEFTYLSPGRCQNTTLIDRLPDVQRYWDACDPYYCDGPGAESFADFIGRAKVARKLLQERQEEAIAIFSHHQFISAILWLEDSTVSKLLPEHMRAYKRYFDENVISNCGIIQMIVKNRK